MIQKQLLPYIENELRAGYDIAAVKAAILKNGYNEKDLDDTLKEYYLKKKPAKDAPGNVRYAGFWIRFVAAFLDGLILYLPASILGVILALVSGIASLSTLSSLGAIVLQVYLEVNKGGSPGKLALGLRITNEEGANMNYGQAVLRYFGKLLSAAVFYIGYFAIGWDSRKQGWHDKIAKTFVVYK